MPSLDAKRYTLDARSGFTLVELLIGIALIAGIAVFIFQIYLSHFKIFSGQSLAVAVASENQIAMDEITNTTREALAALFNCGELVCKVGGTWPTKYFNPDPSQLTHLTLYLWPLDTSGNPIDPDSTSNPAQCVGDYISYYLGDNPKTPTADSDGYYHLTKETAQYPGTICPSSRQHSKKVIASKIKSINFAYTPNSDGTATEIKITVTTEGNTLFKPFKPYTYTRTSIARLKNRASSNFTSISFRYPFHTEYGDIIGSTEQTNHTGDFFSGNILNCPGCRVTQGDVYAQGSISVFSPPIDDPKRHPNYNPDQNIPAINTSYWKAEAEKGGTVGTGTPGSCPSISSGSIGPKKYDCDIFISEGTTLTVKGPIHVTGKLSVQGTLNLDPACTEGTVIIVDGMGPIDQNAIDFGDTSTVNSTGGTSPKYLLFVLTAESKTISVDTNTNFQAILAAIGGGNATNGSKINFSGPDTPNTSFTGVAVANGDISFDFNSINLNQGPNTNPAIFTNCK